MSGCFGTCGAFSWVLLLLSTLRGGKGAGCLCPLSFVFTLHFVSSRYGREEMQRVDVFASCVYPVYVSRIMDSVSYLLLVI